MTECGQNDESIDDPSEPIPLPVLPDQFNTTKRKISEAACVSSLSSTSTGTSTLSSFFTSKSSAAAKKTLSMLTPSCLKPKKNQRPKVGKKKYQRIMGFSDDSASPDESLNTIDSQDVGVDTLGQVIRVGETIRQGTRRKNRKSKGNILKRQKMASPNANYV